MPPSREQRRIGLEAIARIRADLASRPKIPNPFRCDHADVDRCLVCGWTREIPDNLRELRPSA
jgi:hypothetical protein